MQNAWGCQVKMAETGQTLATLNR